MWNVEIRQQGEVAPYKEAIPTDTLHVAIDTAVYHAGLASEKYGSFQITCTSQAKEKDVS